MKSFFKKRKDLTMNPEILDILQVLIWLEKRRNAHVFIHDLEEKLWARVKELLG